MTSFTAQLLSTPTEIKTSSSDKRIAGTHMGKLDPDQRARRKIKNVRTKQHQPINGMHMSCYDSGRMGVADPKGGGKPLGCGHRRHGASKHRSV